MMNRIRTVAVFPTLFTLGNLVCGFFAIVVAARVETPTSIEIPRSEKRVTNLTQNPDKDRPQRLIAFDRDDENHNMMLSAWLIFLAMVFDALDGHVARLVRASTEFGAQLDSLADLVTFGAAPAFLLVKMCHSFAFDHRLMVWVIAASFLACAAMRLARFNVESDEDDDHMNFHGLPTPAAGGVIAGFAILFYTLRLKTNSLTYREEIDEYVQRGLPFFAVLVALLMVSRVPFPHLVNQVFRGQRSFGHVVGVVFTLAAIAAFRGYAVPLVCCCFVLVPPIKYFWLRLVHRRTNQESMF